MLSIYWNARTAKVSVLESQNGNFFLDLNNYRHRIKSMDQNNHFRSSGHDFLSDAKFTIIERIGKRCKHEINN